MERTPSPGSYRPISILPALSKILERVVRDSLIEWLYQHNILPEFQCGFRPNRSVSIAFPCAQAELVAAKSRGEEITIMIHGLSSASDAVSKGPLIEKLIGAGIEGISLKWKSSYMSERTQSATWNNSKSSTIDLTHEVPLGSILGPLLFLTMVADIPKHVTQRATGNVGSKISSYADESAVLAS